jgi:hypothetical protein
MNARQVSQEDIHIAEALETIELELALQVQDVADIGFDAAVDAALTGLGGQILFRLPATAQPDAQAVAAVSVPTGEDGVRKLMIVTLASDGQTMRVENAAPGNNPVADLAQSMAGVLDTFAATNAGSDDPIQL